MLGFTHLVALEQLRQHQHLVYAAPFLRQGCRRPWRRQSDSRTVVPPTCCRLSEPLHSAWRQKDSVQPPPQWRRSRGVLPGARL